jgi:hypothetical protein
MVRRVWLQTGDLVFRSKLRAVVERWVRLGAGGAAAVIEAGSRGWEERVGEPWGGVPVLAFGPHVGPI